MKQPFIFAALAATLISVAPVKAQPMAADLLPSYEVATIIASMGMRPLDRPIWRHGRYNVSAIDRYGREVRVVLDARDGRVLAVRPLARDYVDEPRYAPPPPPAYPRSGPYEPGYDQQYGAPPSPPAAIPGRPPIDDDDEFFDDDRQEGSLMPLPTPRTAPTPREVTTGSLPPRTIPPRTTSLAPSQSTPGVERRGGSSKGASPLPRPRPALANAKPDEPKSDPSNATGSTVPAAGPAASDSKNSTKQVSKPDSKGASNAKTAQGDGAKPEAQKSDIRVIDMSKPKTDDKPEDKPGEAIRF